jgi:hypothetical protein
MYCGMHTDVRHPIPARLHALAAMAHPIERLEHTPLRASAEQYRGVARQITMLLEQAEPDEHLDALLRASPATAELYENLRYAQAGLCRAPLETALNAELEASAVIGRARRAL